MATQLRPVVLADTFEAFAIATGPLSDRGAAVAIGEAADTLDGCLNMAPLVHKQHFFIRHTSALTGKVMLSFYAVKKAKPVLRFHEHQHRMVADLYAEHLFDLAGDAL